jgi:hypothetical protein
MVRGRQYSELNPGAKAVDPNGPHENVVLHAEDLVLRQWKEQVAAEQVGSAAYLKSPGLLQRNTTTTIAVAGDAAAPVVESVAAGTNSVTP